MRISKFLASCGLGSRRKCEDLVRAGKVSLNGKTITDLSTLVNLECDKVTIDGKEYNPEEKVYYLLNKPAGYTSSLSDIHAKKLVTELVPGNPKVWPVGRLDRDTKGLLILTNDGELTQKIIHPKFHVEKEYIAGTKRQLSEQDIEKIKRGIVLEDGKIKPDYFEEISPCLYKIVVHEGRKRLIRRIFQSLGIEKIDLKRTRINNLRLDTTKEGTYRNLTAEEIRGLINE